ncbi:hypothetical protein CRG98_017008 [Punica granatum]|uniref:Uncharacterized protein n=1 Tax=Punica granatum TaxID=22663 RepID=A0A2I0K4F1_PUNGR|nr:hypothetical protein CRG98_017008 [Punica granatum]
MAVAPLVKRSTWGSRPVIAPLSSEVDEAPNRYAESTVALSDVVDSGPWCPGNLAGRELDLTVRRNGHYWT